MVEIVAFQQLELREQVVFQIVAAPLKTSQRPALIEAPVIDGGEMNIVPPPVIGIVQRRRIIGAGKTVTSDETYES